MTTTDYTSNVPRRPGVFNRVVTVLSSVYLLLMVAYLILRLILGGGLWWLALLNAVAVYTFFPLFILMPLAALARSWYVLARLALLALLGIVWFGPFFQPKNVTPAGMQTIRVVTFNVWGDNHQLDEVESWLRETDADVIALQEIPDAYVLGIPALADIYPEQPGDRLRRPWGRMILSRHPVLELTITGANQQRAVLDVDGQQVAVYNIHFPIPVRSNAPPDLTSYTGWLNVALNYDERARNEQIEQFLDELAGEALPYIVAGDFNLSQHSIIYGTLAVRMTDSFRATNSGLGATWPVGYLPPFMSPLLRVDYIWHSRSLRAVATQIGPQLGSDHLPLVATLELLTMVEPGTPEEE
jgi:vancomycin resistance protein VanJ